MTFDCLVLTSVFNILVASIPFRSPVNNCIQRIKNTVVDKNLSLFGNRVRVQNQRQKNGGISYLDTAVQLSCTLMLVQSVFGTRKIS